MATLDWLKFPYEITDAHHHLWDLQAVSYPWLMAKGVERFFGDPTPIQKNYLVEDFRADHEQVPITSSVHIQVGVAQDQNIAEAKWLQDQHERSGLPSAIVAYCDLELNSRSAQLEQLEALATFRGIRQIVGRHPDEDKVTASGSLLNNPEWIAGLKQLEARDLSFDLQLIPDQMERMYEILSDVKSLKVALCHCGSPWYRDTKGYAMWQAGLQQLASLPNVHCKISGLGMFDRKWTTDSLRPIFEEVVDYFGAERCMFGSNFPVDKLYGPYERLWRSYVDLCSNRSDLEKRQLFGETCRTFYHITSGSEALTHE